MIASRFAPSARSSSKAPDGWASSLRSKQNLNEIIRSYWRIFNKFVALINAIANGSSILSLRGTKGINHKYLQAGGTTGAAILSSSSRCSNWVSLPLAAESIFMERSSISISLTRELAAGYRRSYGHENSEGE